MPRSVNSIFNPSFVDRLHHQPRSCRESILAEARSTNYGVVRLELLEQLYEMMYDQRREFGADERRWPHRVIGATSVDGVEASSPSDQLRLRLRSLAADTQGEDATRDTLDVDLVIAATGYRRSAHIDILHDMWDLLPEAGADVDEPAAMATDGWHVSTADGTERKLAVGRDYGVEFQQGLVEEGSGIWLQGCCEGTHGISDTLLSVLATRSGEIVNSIFGTAR
jgi:L-ornithine N5-oxygenase